MSTAKIDSEGRVSLPSGRPGELYDVQQEGEGRFRLTRLDENRRRQMSREECLQAMQDFPLKPTMSWEEMRRLTREP